jgi:uncharacterized protein YoxC
MESTLAEVSLVVIAIMLAVIALIYAVAAITAIKGWRRIDRAMDGVEDSIKKLGQFGPKADHLIEQLGGTLQEARGLVRRTGDVASDVQAVSGELRRGVEMLNVTRRTQAAVAGVRAGFSALVRPTTNGKGHDDV